MSEKASRVSRNSIYLAVGGLVAYAGFLFLLLGLSRLILIGLDRLGVDPVVALWVAPMIIGVVVGAIGYGLIQKAISTLKRESMTPNKTVQSLQENKEWIKEKMH
jgi:xanthine/uracil permease